MSGTDQIVFNTRERATSDDVNNLQSLKDRTFLETMRRMFVTQAHSIGAIPTETIANAVVSGLQVTPSGNDLVVTPGVMFQDSATLSPVPGTLDSDYRWARLTANLAITNPLPGSDTWYLVEVQMDDIVALNTLKDIWDTGAGAFIPTGVDKRTERTVVAQLVAGTATDLPVPSGGDWMVVAGVKVPTGGGPIPTANIMDMRRLWTDIGPALRPAAERGLRQLYNFSGGANLNSFQIAAEAVDDVNGLRLWFNTDENVLAITAAALRWIPSGEAPQAGSQITWYYLATYYGYPVRNAYAWDGFTNLNQNALLVWSDTDVTAGGERNSGTMTLPAPFSNYVVPIGEAVCIAHGAPAGVAVMTHGVNMQRAEETNPAGPLTSSGASPAATPITITAPALSTAKDILYRLEFTRDAAGDRSATITIDDGTFTIATFLADYQVNSQFYFTVPGAPNNFRITFPGTTRPTAYDVQAVGWSL
jgi:hypothetical protein